jgi:hypothetical protein
MALITAAPFPLTDATLKVAANNYETSVSSVEFVPTVPSFSWKGMTPTAVFSFPGSASWVCNVSAIQDWETVDSLSSYLLDHAGETVEMDFYPQNGGQGFRATVTLVPGSIGGAIDTVPIISVSLQVQGTPERITP